MIRIPFSPPPHGTNNGYRIVIIPTKQGKRASLKLDASVVAWKLALLMLIKEQRPDWLPPKGDAVWSRKRNPLRLRLHAMWTLPTLATRFDLDGSLKFLVDAVSAAWDFNDYYVDDIRYHRVREEGCEPSLTLGLEPMEEGQWKATERKLAKGLGATRPKATTPSRAATRRSRTTRS